VHVDQAGQHIAPTASMTGPRRRVLRQAHDPVVLSQQNPVLDHTVDRTSFPFMIAVMKASIF
jgi:hypothetical protein